MYTKTKLRSKQDPNKFEQIYAELENIYQDNFKEGERKLHRRNSIAATLIIIGTILLILVLIQTIIVPNTLDTKLLSAAVITILAAPLLYIKQSSEETSFPRRFKELIIGTLIRKFGKNLILNPEVVDKKNIIETYKEIGYEIYRTDCYSYVDDVITGSLNNGKQVKISETRFQKRRDKNIVEIFGGLFIETTLNKNIKDEIRVLLPTGELYKLANCTKVELDHSNFEKLFNVYSENKITAVQLLTSDALEKLVSLRNDYDMNYDLVIKGNKLYIRLEVGGMFDTGSHRNKLHKEDILVYYSILNYVDLLITEINKIVDESNI